MANKKINWLAIFLIYLFICSNIVVGCGTIGDEFPVRHFPISKKLLEIAIDSLYSKNLEYNYPIKWASTTDMSKSGYDFLESRFFYFNTSPEEMYWVFFVGDSEMLADPNNSRIAIAAVYSNLRWKYGRDMDAKEIQGIQNRFDSEIISKLELYSNSKVLNNE